MTQHGSEPLAKPFDRVFATTELAFAVREVVLALLEETGMRGPQDPRLATTVFRDKLHVNVGNWLVASMLSRGQQPSEIGLLFRQDHGLADWRSSSPFANDSKEPPVVVAYLSYEDLATQLESNADELLGALGDAAHIARRRFEGWAGSPYRHAHQPWMAKAYYDEDVLEDVLRTGLPDQEAVQMHAVMDFPEWRADGTLRSYRLSPRTVTQNVRDAGPLPRVRRGDVLVHLDGEDVRSAGVVMGSTPYEQAPSASGEIEPAIPRTFDARVRAFPTHEQVVSTHWMPSDESDALTRRLPNPGQPSYMVPDHIARDLLEVVLDGAPEDVQDLVSWVKRGIEARVEDVEDGRLALPKGPITDRLRTGDVRVVKIAPGRGGILWDEFLEEGIAAVGWDAVGALQVYADFDAFRPSFLQHYPYGGNVPAATKKAREAWTLRELAPGDLVVANRGISEVLGIGEVIEPGYEWRDGRREYRHTVRVRWDDRYHTKIPPQRYWAVVTVLELEPDQLLTLLQAGSEEESAQRRHRVRLLRVPSGQARLRESAAEGAVGDRVSLPVGEHDDNADLATGDTVVLWQSGEDSGLHGLGEALSAPHGDPDSPDASLSVDLRITAVLAEPIPSQDVVEDDTLSGLEVLQVPTRSIFVVDEPEWEALESLLFDDVTRLQVQQPKYPVSDVAKATGLAPDLLERWVRAIHRKGQAILYGPPGTGKTYVAKELAKHLVAGGDGIVRLLQFHAATAYEDFMQGLRPEIDANGNLSYVLAPGGFLKFVREATARRGVSVLILDEINRADLARVFGELMYLLEYRGEKVALAAGGKMLSVPGKVRILGTMNTADRSVALVDHALRRRFAFLRLEPDLDLLKDWHRGKAGERLAHRLADELARLHVRIDDPHLALGISYFLVEDLPSHLPDIWRMEIEPYLEELFFDEADPLGEFAWDAVAVRLDVS